MKNQLPSSTSQLKDFDFLNLLGKGSFGVVYKVRRKRDKSIYVLKQIDISSLNSKHRNDAINEVTILSKLDNPFIVKYYDSFIEKNHLNIVMEYCEGGDLSSHMRSYMGRPLQENKIWKFTIQMCLGLEYLHSKKILHRDIKTMNIFLNKEENIRIGDLGVAKVLCESMNFAHTMVGTPYYLSPEMCEEKPYNEKSDIWALGCVIYELCTSKHPFDANNQGALILRIIRGKYTPIPGTYSTDLSELVECCLSRDYRKRPKAGEILKKTAVANKARLLNISLDKEEINNNAAMIKNLPTSTSNNSNLNMNNKSEEVINNNPANRKKDADKPKDNNINPWKKEIKPPATKIQEKPMKVKQPANALLANNNKQINNQNNNNKIAASPYPQKKTPNISNVKDIKAANNNKAKEISKEKDSTPKSNQNNISDERNVKRIRKGAPQQISRQAQNAALINQKLIKKPPSPLPEPQKVKIERPEKDPFAKELKENRSAKDLNKKELPSFVSTPYSKPQAFVKGSKAEYEEVYNLPDNVFKAKKPKKEEKQMVVDDDFIEKAFEISSPTKDSKAQSPLKQPIFNNIEEKSPLKPLKNPNVPVESPTKSVKSQIKSTEQEEESKENSTNVSNPFLQNLVSQPTSKTHSKFQEEDDYFQINDNKSQHSEEKVSEDNENFSKENEGERDSEEDHEAYEVEDQENNDNDGEMEENNENNENSENNENIENSENNENETNVIENDGLREILEASNENSEGFEPGFQEDSIKEEEKNHEDLKGKYEDAIRRDQELRNIIEVKVRDCEKVLGKKVYEEIIVFFRAKLNSEKELDEDDQDEIDVLVEEKLASLAKPEIMYTIYKILHLEIELDKNRERIKEIEELKNKQG